MRALIIIATLALAFPSGCSDDGNNSGPKDAAVIDAPPSGGPDASCFTNPTTYNEIINACTTAQKIYKHPTLPLLGSNGQLPPLP
jgi:hypothetical protein